ncbi:transcriptional regulator [Actinoplanes sp. NPDC051851]|uniref:helix-turn-helix transcriptional regulator n=1 Tax=Actinoplanes sp. NPDC051851 TaxID=3154753 RepID=UPI00342C4012
MTTPDDIDDLDALAGLTDGVRRAAYRVVAAGAGPVGRDDVAEALGIGRTLAAFHLDKLAASGLLDVSYARKPGRSGPGAGRPAKLYHVAAGEHAVSVPPRAYRGAAELLAEALEQAGAEEILYRVAGRHGRQTGRDPDVTTPPAGRDPDVTTLLTGRDPDVTTLLTGRDPDVTTLLTGQGYAPAADGPDRIVLRNCPFHRLSEQFPPMICGMNLAMVQGLLDGAGADGEWAARMDPAPGRCCVTLSKKQFD